MTLSPGRTDSPRGQVDVVFEAHSNSERQQDLVYQFFGFRNHVVKLGIAKDFTHKFEITLFKGILENLILPSKDNVQHLILESGFELFKNLSILNQHSIKSELLGVEVLNTSKDGARQGSIL